MLLRVGLLLPLVFAFAGCSNEPAAVATGPANAAAAATRARTAMSLSIVSVSPETFSVTGGRAAWQVLEVAYTILDPAKVQSARVEVYAREIGVISRMDVPVQASGTVRFLVDPQGPSDFGPSVRFRASCPEGTTDWYELGQEPLPSDNRTADTLRVTNVNPSSIKEGPDESEDGNQRGVGIRVSVYGRKLSAACSIDGQVDGSPVQLNNPLFLNGHFEALLMRRDLGYRSVSPRYVELKFSIRGPGIGQVAIKNMKIGQ